MSVATPDSRANCRTDADPAEERGAGPAVRVMLPLPLPEPLDYLAPDGMAVPKPGSFVRVTLGPRRVVGVVWDGESAGDVPTARLKPIVEMLPTPPLQPELRRFIDRVAAYTLAPPGAVLRMAMSVPDALLPPAPHRLCAVTPAGLAALDAATPLTAARRRVLETLRDEGACAAAEAARRAECGVGVVRGLIGAGLVGEQLVADEARAPAVQWDTPGPALSR